MCGGCSWASFVALTAMLSRVRVAVMVLVVGPSEVSTGSRGLGLLCRWEVRVASSEECLREDDDLRIGDPALGSCSAQALHIAPLTLIIIIVASWSFARWPTVWHGPTLACVPAGAGTPFLVVGGGSRSRQLRRNVCVMTMTFAGELDGNFLSAACVE
ncbi:hypothetical protein BRADI_5g07365v3 [Brachypodium distachyon]|uniref:Secreted protein n=1 Tax=Brachypodium distachyon TaxID=15368 RepID=A0A2K2CFT4_BRADI|nr:hypothetical protein BRADI_5g07365v3 [Brachypodium distachyon]